MDKLIAHGMKAAYKALGNKFDNVKHEILERLINYLAWNGEIPEKCWFRSQYRQIVENT